MVRMESGQQGEAGDTVTESESSPGPSDIPPGIGEEGWYRGPTPVPSCRDGCFFCALFQAWATKLTPQSVMERNVTPGGLNASRSYEIKRR